MELHEFVAKEVIGRLIYPHGLPDALRSPPWSPEGHWETSECQREVFLPMAADVPGIDLDVVVVSYSCLGFMGVEEARDWTPVWMCASVHAYRTEVGFAGEVAFATSGKLAAQLRSGVLPSSRESIVEFYKETYGACDRLLLEAMVDVLGIDARQETHGRWDEE